jgi:hypothetical protein
MGKIYRLLAIIFFIMVPISAILAQEISISGSVSDNEGETLPGVSVVVKGTTQGTVTGFDGEFIINAPEGSVLVFSYVGFQSQEIAVTGSRKMHVVLRTQAVGLDELVVVGYGTQTRTTVTVATSTIKGDALDDIPTATVSSRLQGRLAGVAIRTNSAQPGRELEIRVRGGSSINKSNTPLVLIDGFQRSITNLKQ